MPYLLIAFSLFHFSALFSQEFSSQKTIRSVEIIRQDVFSEITSKPRFLYEWANSLHIVTKENVIRRELLFKTGDVFDKEILQESERKLRRFSYLGEVQIFVKVEDEKFVDVTVKTQDQWSTLLSAVFRSEGGRTIYGGALEEFNLLGFGKRIFFEAKHEPEGNIFTFRYTDPQLFSSRWTTQETFITGTFIKNLSAQITRPFFGLDTKWAGGMSASVNNQTLRLFDAKEEVSRLRFESDGFQLFAARAFGRRFKKTKLQLTYRFRRRDFGDLGKLTTIEIPNDELIHSLGGAVTRESIGFVKEKQIDKFLRTEDLTLGTIASVSLRRTGIPITKGVKRFEVSANIRQASKIFSKQYFFLVLGFQTLFERDTIGSLLLRYYNKLLPRQTLAFNAELDVAENLETSRQFLLGGDTGLRGFSARQFTGNKRLLFNFEDRIFTSLDILTVAFGGVLFFDAGNVWKENESINLKDLNYSVGFGLRLGYTKSPDSRVGRIDFAWPLKGDSGFGVSIGVDQQFSVN